MLKIIRRIISFADWQQTHPSEPPPGDMLDAQFDEIIDQVDGWDARVRRAIRDDGKIAAHAVNRESLDPGLVAILRDEIIESIAILRETAEIAARNAESAKIHAEAAESRVLEAESAAKAAAIEVKQSKQLAMTDVSQLTHQAELLRDQLRDARAALSVEESHAGHSEAWADVSHLWAEHMPDTLPDTAIQAMDVTGDHWSSKWWANRADNAFGRLTDLYLGAWPEPPTTNLEGGPIQPGSIYFDTDPEPGQMYVWTGSQWASMTQPARAMVSTLWYQASEGQTVFPLTTNDLYGHSYTISASEPEPVSVYANGVKLMPYQAPLGDWTIDASTVTLERPVRAEDLISIDIYLPDTALGPGAVNAWSLALVEAKDGIRTSFSLVNEATTPIPTVNKNEELLVSLDGVIQEPGVSYNSSGDTISFAQAPAADSWVFITWFRSEGGVVAVAGEPVDWADITGKPATFPPDAHSHSYASLTGIPATFAPSAHNHAQADITGLPAALTSGLARANHTGTQAVTTITGLGSAATKNIHVGTTAPGSPAVNDIWIDTT